MASGLSLKSYGPEKASERISGNPYLRFFHGIDVLNIKCECYQDIQQAAEEEHREYPGVEAHGRISAAPLMTSAALLMSAAGLRPTRGPSWHL